MTTRFEPRDATPGGCNRNPGNSPTLKLLAGFLRACKHTDIPPGRFVLTVSLARQTVFLHEKSVSPSASGGGYRLRTRFRCSTSRFGAGQIAGSNCTPLGLHRVGEKIGGGWPAGTVFKGRRPVGFTWRGLPDAKITTRILWLEGLEPGVNRGGAVDSHARYIYIHGTADQASIGRPASCGCIHLSDTDLIPLFERLPGGTLVWIAES